MLGVLLTIGCPVQLIREVFLRSESVHNPLFSRKIVEIERFALRAAVLHECQNYMARLFFWQDFLFSVLLFFLAPLFFSARLFVFGTTRTGHR